MGLGSCLCEGVAVAELGVRPGQLRGQPDGSVSVARSDLHASGRGCQSVEQVAAVQGVGAPYVFHPCADLRGIGLLGVCPGVVAQAGDVLPALRLPGSHLAVVRAGGKVWEAGDRAGLVPVYWLEEDDGLWWATAAAPLAALIGAAPNLPWLLAELTLNGTPACGTPA
ncbi:hypothetical protein ACH4U6_36435 [Streptomyces netropsis]|uniref:hypothetical protein n=1 Tax=Streptomyces netropsis TaxID=55404 RepID=UPI0037B45D9A